MDQQGNIAIDRADEEILAYTASDETLEAAAGTERGSTFALRAGPTIFIFDCL